MSVARGNVDLAVAAGVETDPVVVIPVALRSSGLVEVRSWRLRRVTLGEILGLGPAAGVGFERPDPEVDLRAQPILVGA